MKPWRFKRKFTPPAHSKLLLAFHEKGKVEEESAFFGKLKKNKTR